jgi:hypothetical protein
MGVSAFAELLEEALTRQPEPLAEMRFEGSLRAFEHALASFASVDGLPASASWPGELGVEPRCTVDDVKRAFRRLAFATHPDRPGGSHVAFIRARALLDEALGSSQPMPKLQPVALRYARYAPAKARQVQSTYA